jgi:hypothetical protein
VTAIENALAAGNLDAAYSLVPWDKFEDMQKDVMPELKSVLNKSGAQAAKSLSSNGIPITFNQTNPKAVNWIIEHAAEMVTKNVMPSSQQAIRDLIHKSFADGVTPYNTAIKIRDQIGLLPTHIDAVENYRLGLINGGMAEAAANLKAGKYAEQLIKYRAENIARTESIRALSEGQQQLWNQAIEKGLLIEDEWERVWIASDPCSICDALNESTAPINEPFEGGYMYPPDPHPSCQCVVALQRVQN